MKSTKKKDTSTLSKFWNAENTGDKIEGKFGGFFDTKFGLAIQIGLRYVSMSKTGLKLPFLGVWETLKSSDTIKIEMYGEGEKKGKLNAAKFYAVYLNGKRLEGHFNPASKASLTDFFFKKMPVNFLPDTNSKKNRKQK
jgi:hypothetical protein